MPHLLQRSSGQKSTNGELDIFGSLRREMGGLFEDIIQGFGHLIEPDFFFGLPTKIDVSESDDALTVPKPAEAKAQVKKIEVKSAF